MSFNSVALEDTLDYMFYDNEDLEEIRNENSEQYRPHDNPPLKEFLTWDFIRGYGVRCYDEYSIGFEGTQLLPDTTIVLQDSSDLMWNYICYVPDDTMRVATAFNSISSDVVQVKNDDGDWWTPSSGTNFLMEPYEGYQICVKDDVNFSYPVNESESSGGGNSKGNDENNINTVLPTHYSFQTKTGDFQAISIDTITVNGESPNIGDEVAIYTPAGLCVGAGVFNGEFPLCLTAWKDDPCTEEIDGYTPGELISYKLWDTEANIEIDLNLSGYFIESSSGNNPRIYEGSIICGANLSGSYVIPEEYSLSQNYPNPFNPETIIKYNLKWNSKVNISIYNVLGREMIHLVDGIQTSGNQTIRWDGKSASGVPVASGMYFLKIKAEATDKHFNKLESFEKSMKMLMVK